MNPHRRKSLATAKRKGLYLNMKRRQHEGQSSMPSLPELDNGDLLLSSMRPGSEVPAMLQNGPEPSQMGNR